MHDSAIATLTSRAAAMSRRTSLRWMSGASLTGLLAAPVAVRAGKAKNAAKRRCKREAAQCRTGVERSCLGGAACLEAHLPCCEHLAQCRADLGVVCLSKGAPLPAAT